VEVLLEPILVRDAQLLIIAGFESCLRHLQLHESGEERCGEFPLPDPASARRQYIGSAITYARRYSFSP
jgi:hypothetical protein